MDGARILDSQADGLVRRYRVALDGGRIDAAVDARLRALAPTARLPGFRPGKVPPKVLRARLGRRLRDEEVDRRSMAVARDLIREHDLSPGGRPTIHIDPDAPETFVLTLEVAPEIDLGDVSGLRIRRLRPATPDAALEARAEAQVRRQLLDALAERHDFPVPEAMVESEHRRILAGFEETVGEAADAETAAELGAIAERRIRLALLLAEIARREDITIGRDEVEAMIEAAADRDPEHHAEIIDYYLDHPTAVAELQSPAFEARVIDVLLERCDVVEETLGADALARALDEAEGG